jgi:hypothetical protein
VEQEGVSKEKGIFAATPPMSITIAHACGRRLRPMGNAMSNAMRGDGLHLLHEVTRSN